MVSGTFDRLKSDSTIRLTTGKAYLPMLEDASQCQTKKQKSPQ
jgi:hypothetical protein